jgi:TolB-like protein/DNA-binding winged helix-turn-helix (wHTH) protein
MTPEQAANSDLVLDLVSFQLVRGGQRLKLERTPMELLSLLASRPGALVTREEIVQRLWGDAVHVDVDAGTNTAVRKIRLILDDDPACPRYLETVVGKGYRFIGPITVIDNHRSAVATRSTTWRRPGSGIKRTLLAAGLASVFFLILAAVLYTSRLHSRREEAPVSIAVVPLENLSETQGQDFFVNGLTEEIITELGQLNPGRIRVVTYESSPRERKSLKTDFADKPELQYVLEGSVRRLGERIRISVRLVRITDDTALWTESFDRNIGDVLGLQAEIAQRIGRELQVKIYHRSGQGPVASELVETYFRGRFELQSHILSVPDAAREDFARAIALDASYAPAYAGLADFYRSRAVVNDAGAEQNWRLADQYAAKALSLDPDSAETHVAIAQIRLLHDWDWRAAREHAVRALQLNPSSPDAHAVYARYLTVEGNMEEAISQRKQAVALDPVRDDLKQQLTRDLYFAHRYQDIVTVASQTLASDPHNQAAHDDLCFSLGPLKRFPEAIAECGNALVAAGHADWVRSYNLEYRRHGFEAASSFVGKKQLAEVLSNPNPDLWDLANVYAIAGMREEALRTLFQALQTHDPGLLQIRVDPDFDLIRDDPRYNDLMRRISFPD